MLTMLTLIGCTDLGFLDDTGVDTGNPDAVTADILAWCNNTSCSEVGLYGGTSGGSITNYIWEVDGIEVASGLSETSTTVDMSKEVGNFVEVKLTVEDSGGNISETSMNVGNLGTITAEDEIQAIIIMPPPTSCSAEIPVSSIGGCVTGLTKVGFEVWDLDANSNTYRLRADGALEFEFAGPGSVTPPTNFSTAAAWYLFTNNLTVMLEGINQSQYSIESADFDPQIVDPVIDPSSSQAPPPANYTEHFTFWFQAMSHGTEIRTTHTTGSGTYPSPFKLQSNCNTKAGTMSFSIVPAK